MMPAPPETALPIPRKWLCVIFGLLMGVQPSRAENPVFPGWYADPEAVIIDGRYWIFPTTSAPYAQQLHLDAFSSPDLVRWTRHDRIIEAGSIKWLKQALWAPSVIAHDQRFYLFFSANDIQRDGQPGGIGVAVADKPQGPYTDHLGKPLIDAFHHGAQPIDPFVFRDDDGARYLIYGGWKHCNIARLNDDFTGFVPFENGEVFRSITPEGYVEGPFVFKRNGKYYFMWSEGDWAGPGYRVAYAISDHLLGPHRRIGVVLRQDPSIATGAGHHSIIHHQARDAWFIVYHRRPLGESDGNHRVVCIDRLEFDARGMIKPVAISNTGVAACPLK